MTKAPVFALVRPRDGNFNYDNLEVQQMIYDIKALCEAGANGLVFGALNK